MQPLKPVRVTVYEDPNCLNASSFDRLTAVRGSPNLKRLDAALIDTLSIQKRLLASELGKQDVTVRVEDISVLFNAILFVRAMEDHRRHQSPNTRRALVEAWLRAGNSAPRTLRSCITSCLRSLDSPGLPKSILDIDRLRVFDLLDRETVLNLFSDFYDNRFAPYKYDFSVMSKHALSRIYERYVSMLRDPESPQPTLFGDPLPDEISDRALGGRAGAHFGRFG